MCHHMHIMGKQWKTSACCTDGSSNVPLYMHIWRNHGPMPFIARPSATQYFCLQLAVKLTPSEGQVEHCYELFGRPLPFWFSLVDLHVPLHFRRGRLTRRCMPFDASNIPVLGNFHKVPIQSGLRLVLGEGHTRSYTILG